MSYPTDLPIPPEQFFYADVALNPQHKPLKRFINYIHYPTLGCPALLGPEQMLQVLLSLPANVDAARAAFGLIDRHQKGAVMQLQRQGDPEHLEVGPGGERQLSRHLLKMADVPFALFDLQVRVDGLEEVQYNAVCRYQAISGNEKVVFCGDPQFHVDNRVCLEKFIEHVNPLDVAWIAIIGDVCDNGVKGVKNILWLAATAHKENVVHYYGAEYGEAHKLLRTLRHPVVLIPGNHDGMAAFPNYDEGKPSDVFTGPDSKNDIEYDGLQHFQCTFGPLHFRFDWDKTRYLCTNTFELTRCQRLGYHAIVANWGGWMRPKQVDWLKRELEAAKDMRKVMLMHHDPRGGSEGIRLGQYHRLRPYTYDWKGPIALAYLSYLLKHGRKGWQQEWMAPEHGDIAAHPVKDILSTMLTHDVWAVIMGHDNENWVDSYFQGYDLFQTEASTIRYATRADVGNDKLVNDIIDFLESDNYEEVSKILEAKSEEEGEMALSAALDAIESNTQQAEIVFSANPAKEWGLEVKSAIHFIHVDDVGAYKYTKNKHFDDYGFVLADLEGGAPKQVQSHRISGKKGDPLSLEVD